MGTQLHALKDHTGKKTEGFLDLSSRIVYADPEGLKPVSQLEETEFLCGDRGEPLRDENGQMIHVSALANSAAEAMYGPMVQLCGKAPRVAVLDAAGRLARDAQGRLVTMDLAIGDVHVPAAMPNYAGGYQIAEGIADVLSPVLLVPKQSGYYYTSNSDNDFKRKLPTGGAAGAGTGEVNPGYAAALYAAKQYILGGYLPTEVLANADVPLKPLQKLTQMVVDAHRLEREIRVQSQLTNTANWNANLVTTLAAGSQWNGGAAADPIANIHHAMEQSYMPVTAMACSELAFHDLVRAAALQKFIQYKQGIDPLPSAEEFGDALKLPKLFVGNMKYAVGGAATYVWGNDFVLLRQPKEMPPTTQLDIATAMTFRWTGGEAPDGTMTGGMLVRSYFDPKRGGRGGNVVVVIMEDTELMTSGLVGGVLKSVHQ